MNNAKIIPPRIIPAIRYVLSKSESIGYNVHIVALLSNYINADAVTCFRAVPFIVLFLTLLLP